jgi:hypothetical protein
MLALEVQHQGVISASKQHMDTDKDVEHPSCWRMLDRAPFLIRNCLVLALQRLPDAYARAA